MTEEPMCKGNILFQFKQIVRQKFGDEKVKEIISRCSPEYQKVLEGTIISSLWYPERLFAELIEKCEEVLGVEEVKKGAREMAKNSLNTVFRMVLQVWVTPKMMSEKNEKLWVQLHNTGKLTVPEYGEKFQKIVITGFDFINKSYERMFIEYHCAVMEMIGGKNCRGSSVKIAPYHYQQVYHWD